MLRHHPGTLSALPDSLSSVAGTLFVWDCALQLMQQTPPAELPPQAPFTPEQMRDFMGPYPRPARGNGTIKVASPPQTLSGMMQAIQHFNPKSGVKAPPKFGQLSGFRPLRVPVVFHCECLVRPALGER